MGKSNPKIVVILGPTASGKSSLAITLARKFEGEIISADSRQVYRGMDLGTGKVTRSEQEQARHWLLDIASPRTEYNVAKFKRAADGIIRDILRRNKLPIVCGGTGFWISAVVDNVVFPDVKPDRELRNKLRNKSAHVLFAQLRSLDPQRAQNIDPQNKVRLIRAIEIAKALGRVPDRKKPDPKYDALQIGIGRSKKILDGLIRQRLHVRLRRGMLAEVKKLHAQGVSWKRLDSFGLEYRWLARFLQKKISRSEMEEKLYFDIVHYAKRQLTWFDRDRRIRWISDPKNAARTVRKFIKKTD